MNKFGEVAKHLLSADVSAAAEAAAEASRLGATASRLGAVEPRLGAAEAEENSISLTPDFNAFSRHHQVSSKGGGC